jgi:hypothetical protein
VCSKISNSRLKAARSMILACRVSVLGTPVRDQLARDDDRDLSGSQVLKLCDVRRVGQRRAVNDHLAGVDVLVDRRAAGVPLPVPLKRILRVMISALPRRVVLVIPILSPGCPLPGYGLPDAP